MKDNPKVLNFYHLLKCKFNIPEYQRGYRWEKKQVIDLLNDIKDFIRRRDSGKVNLKEFYCLQPVVVFNTSENEYDVIDGQQRLTTLYLILKALKSTIEDYCNSSIIYKIGYSKFASFPNLDYLNSDGFLNDDNRQYESADNFFLRKAYKEIQDWFVCNKSLKVSFAQLLMNEDCSATLPDDDKKDISVIWYETVNGNHTELDSICLEKESIEIFNRLNYGKIKLTDTELIKALIMQSDCYSGEKHASMEQWTSKVASDWDMIEKKLHNPFFWSMLNAVEDKNNPSHIRFILSYAARDIYNECINCGIKSDGENQNLMDGIKNDDHFDYIVIDRWLSQEGKEREILVKEFWNRVIDIFSLFESWYEDLETYHRIGLIVLFMERSSNRNKVVNNLINELYAKRSFTKSAFLKELDTRISKFVTITSKDNHKNLNTLKTINYHDNSEEIIRILELVNVIDHLRKPNDDSRFPFHLFKKYNVTSLEHIHPQHIIDMPFKDACDWLKRKRYEMEKLEAIKDVSKAKEAAAKLVSSLVYLDESSENKSVRDANKKANQEAEKKYEQSLEVKALMKEVDKVFDELAGMKDTEMHSISNMALVDQPTNSALQNFLLDTKRSILQERSKASAESGKHTFVPISTEMAFNKVFSKSVNDLKLWTLPDRNDYYAHIESIYNEFVK